MHTVGRILFVKVYLPHMFKMKLCAKSIITFHFHTHTQVKYSLQKPTQLLFRLLFYLLLTFFAFPVRDMLATFCSQNTHFRYVSLQGCIVISSSGPPSLASLS